MSLGMIYKGTEGLVLAADSRVTMTTMVDHPVMGKVALPATFDSATKLLRVEDQKWIGAVTYGLGVVGQKQPRTAHSYLTELEQELPADRIGVHEFASKLSDFYGKRIADTMPGYNGQDMIFLVAGYDENDAYGRVFQIGLPSSPAPVEQHNSGFGIAWGGQKTIVERLLNGVDEGLLVRLKDKFNLDDTQTADLYEELRKAQGTRIPYQFLPLQDGVDLCTMLIRTTRELQRWVVDIRGVGGLIDVATITRTHGWKDIQVKEIQGERQRDA